MDKQKDGQTDRLTENRCTDRKKYIQNRETDIQTDIKTGKWTDRYRNRQAHRWTDRIY